jgi:hypothetical protein
MVQEGLGIGTGINISINGKGPVRTHKKAATYCSCFFISAHVGVLHQHANVGYYLSIKTASAIINNTPNT